MKKQLRFMGGHILDIDPSEIAEPLLNLAHNVNTRKGFPSRIGGRRIAYGVSDGHAPIDPLHLLNLNLNTFNWWMLFGANSIYAVEGSNAYDITHEDGQETVANPSDWSSTLLNGIPVFSNGRDPLLYWNGVSTDPVNVLPDWPDGTIAKYVTAFRYHIFALNIDGPAGVFDNLLMWSHAAEPGTLPNSWTAAPGNEAGSAYCADTPGRLICAGSLNTQLFLYKPTSIYVVEYVGQQPDNIFTVRPINRAVGILGPHCSLDLGTRRLVVGNDDVYIQDGLNVSSIAENRIKRYLANSIDETYAQNTFVVRDPNKKECWVCVPEPGSQYATVAHIWDERRDTWVTKDLFQARYASVGIVSDETANATWDGDEEPWDSDDSAWNEGSIGSVSRIVVAQEELLYVEDVSLATMITSTLAKYDLDFGDDAFNKLVTRIHIVGTGLTDASSILIRVGHRQDTTQPIQWNPFISADLSGEGTPCEANGRYVSIEIQVISDSPWSINRVTLIGGQNGNY